MPRRVGLPGASELFRSTAAVELSRPDARDRRTPDAPGAGGPSGERRSPDAPDATPGRPERDRTPAASGRVKHEEKITVYVSNEELLALERLRLDLRAEHGVAVDRGRIVRAAIAEALADVAAHGADSALLRRLAKE